MTALHETDRFRNAATYTVAVTYTVAGGARPETAHRRARRVAERVAAATARLADVVEATAVAGAPGIDGELVAKRPVAFARANAGTPTHAPPHQGNRYVDPDHEAAMVSLGQANRRDHERREADQRRRQTVSCLNTWRTTGSPAKACACVYCQPDRHLDLLTDPAARAVWTPRCICGHHVTDPGDRCQRHRDVDIVVLDDDNQDLHAIDAHLREATP